MEKLGVLLINSSRIYGGTETWTLRAAAELKNRGYRVIVGYRFPVIKQHADDFGLPIIKFPLRSDSDIYSIYLIRKTLLKNNLHVVLPTRDREYWLGTIAAKLAGCKSIIRLGIVRILKNKWKNRTLYGKWADAIQVNAQAIVDGLLSVNFIPQNKIHQFYDGVEVPPTLPDNANTPPFTFVYVGSLIARKNVSQLLGVFHKLTQSLPDSDIRLWLVGEGEEEANLKQLAQELKIRDMVKFWGHQDDVPAILQQCHAMVLLSKSEGFPTVLLEGMACGVPPVVGSIPGIDEVVNHETNGLIVNLDNETEIVRAMKRMVQDKSFRIQLRETGFKEVKEKFSRAAMGENLEKLILEVVNG